MIVNNVELEDLEISNYDISVKYENELSKVQKIINDSINLTKRSDVIKAQCTAIFDFFDVMFGLGTAKAVFGDKTNLVVSMRAFDEVVQGILQKDRADAAKINQLTNKYSRKDIKMI